MVQIGSPSDPKLRKALDFRGLNLRQEAYVIENADLHVGNDHAFLHLAAIKETPYIGLFGPIPSKNRSPFGYTYGICIDPPRQGKPSYNPQENPKEINKIKPETVAGHICDILEIEPIRINTVRIGSLYHIERLDFVPDFPLPPEVFNGKRIVCRYDLAQNERFLFHFLTHYFGTIITDDPLPPAVFEQFKGRVHHIHYNIDKNLDIGFVTALHYSGIPYDLVTAKTDKELADLKIELFDFNQLKGRPKHDISDLKPEMRFKTNRMFLSRNKFYPTIWHLQEDEVNDKLTGVSSARFQEALDHLYIYE